MNYRDYVEIMADEELTLPNFAKYTLENAIWCNDVIKKLKSETGFNVARQVKAMEEKKIGYILEAIEWARLAKEMPDAFKWGERLFERATKRDIN